MHPQSECYHHVNFVQILESIACSLLFFLPTDFAAALCDPIAYHQEADKRQEQLKSLLDEEDLEDVSF